MKFASVLAVVLSGFCLLCPTFLLAESNVPVEQTAEVVAPVEITTINHTKVSEDQENITFTMDGSIEVRMFAIGGEYPRLVIDFPNAIYRKKNVMTPSEGELAENIRIGLHTEPKRKTRVVVDLTKNFDVDYKHTLTESENLLEVVLAKGEARTIAAIPVEDEPAAALDIEVEQQEAVEVAHEKEVVAVVTPPVKKEEEIAAEKKKMLEALPLDKKPIPPVFAEKEEVEKEVVTANEVAADVPQLLEVSFDDSSERGEMVLFHLNDFFPPTVSAIEKNNPRVLCEFPNMNMGDGVQKEILAKGKYVEAIRTEMDRESGSVQVLLDLSPDRDYDLQQVFFKNDNLFVLIVNELREVTVRK